jgi:RNA polymerase sigma-70 factor (ECF subfamily)
MSLRLSRLVFGSLPGGEAALGDAIGEVPATIAPTEPSLVSQIRQKLLSDESLAENLQCGDTDALTVLFERHGARLFGVARRVLRNDSEAEDAVQQIFLDVFRSIQQFDPDKGAFRTWLFMFGYQRIFNRRRSLAANRFFDTDSYDEIMSGIVPKSERSKGLSLAESAILIEQALSGLQPRQRRTIKLVYYEGLTAEEVSVRTGETVRVVRHNLYRGLEKLRRVVCADSSTSGNASKGGDR